jgi:hypothetical protein
MLPDLKVVICGIAFCVLLFVAAGGVTPPETRTHVGEMPEVVRPMMQESMAETPEAPPLLAMMAVRGGGEGPREAAQAAGGPGGADSPDADTPDADTASGDHSSAETSGATPSPHDLRGDPLKGLLDSLPAPATTGPPSSAGAARVFDARAPLPLRRAATRRRRQVPSVVQHHRYVWGSGGATR